MCFNKNIKSFFVKIILCIVFIFSYYKTSSQNYEDTCDLKKLYEFTSLKEALANPLEVYSLNLKKKKLTSIPSEIFTLKNLKVLNLSKNHIKNVPEEIGKLTNLVELDLSNNKINILPPSIGNLINIKKLILNKNKIEFLPKEISNLSNLEILDLWGNQITEFPEEIKKLNYTLKILDLRVIFMTQKQQDNIQKLLPDVNIYFSKGCNCK